MLCWIASKLFGLSVSLATNYTNFLQGKVWPNVILVVCGTFPGHVSSLLFNRWLDLSSQCLDSATCWKGSVWPSKYYNTCLSANRKSSLLLLLFSFYFIHFSSHPLSSRTDAYLLRGVFLARLMAFMLCVPGLEEQILFHILNMVEWQ